MAKAAAENLSRAAPVPALRAFMLGRFAVEVHGQPLADHAWRRRKARQLLKCLLLRPGFRMPKDEAVELLWPDSDLEAGAVNLRSAAHAIRRVLETAGLRGGGVSINRDVIGLHVEGEVWVDAAVFESLLEAAAQAADPLPMLEAADGIYAADLLPEDAYENWAAERRQVLRRQWTELQYRLAALRGACGNVEGAARALLRLLQADPCEERAAQDLMILYVRQGRRADALRVYRRLVQALRTELQVEPSDATEALHRQIVQGDLPLGRPPVTPESTPSDRAEYVCSHPFPAPTRLVGRGHELERLGRLLERASCECQIALIGGPAGTGKSTLAGALVRRARAAGALCLAGGSYEQQGAALLGPFRDAIADYLLAQPPARLESILQHLAPDLYGLIPELRYHLGAPDQGRAERHPDASRLFAAIHALLRILAERGPVLLCLEDLHAADELSLQLIRFLARQIRRLPIVLLATYRAEEATPGGLLAQLLAQIHRDFHAEHLMLEPLDRADTRRLVASLLDGPASQELDDWLYATTDGNPLFVEQLVLALREQGQLTLRGGVWHGTPGIDRGVPPIIREVIGERLSRVSERCRETLAMAAVLGRSIQHETLLAALAPRPESEVFADLQEALSAATLSATTTGYSFSHALVRETVYWGLDDLRRMQLHARAGETLERLAGSRTAELSAELAHHFSIAERLEGVRQKAIAYCLQAGRRASELSAYREALDHFGRAWDLIERHADRADRASRLAALGGKAYAEQQLGSWLAAIASFRRLLELSDDPIDRASARSAIAFSLQQIGKTDAALDEADQGLRELAGRPAAAGTFARLRLQFQKAVLWFLHGRFRALVDLGREMEAAAIEIDHPRALFWAHSTLAMAANGSGRVSEAVEQYRAALAAAERAQDKVQMATGHSNLGLQLYRGGEFASARQHLETALGLYRDAANELRAVLTVQALGRLELAEGNLAGAERLAEQALALALEARDRWEAECHDLIGQIASARGEWAKATASFQRAIDIRRRVGHRAGLADSLNGLGLVRERAGDLSSARDLYAESLAITDLMDPGPQAVAAGRHLGRVLLKLGDPAGRDALERSLSLVAQRRQTLEHEPTLLAAAALRWIDGLHDEAVRLAETCLRGARTAESRVAARCLLATILSHAGSTSIAARLADEAVELARATGAGFLEHLALSAAEQARVRHSDVDSLRARAAALTPF